MHVSITVVTFKTAKVQPRTQKCFALCTKQVPKAGLQVSQQNLSISSLCLHTLWMDLLCLYRKKKNVGNTLSFTPHIYSHLCAPPQHTEPEGTTGDYCQLPKGRRLLLHPAPNPRQHQCDQHCVLSSPGSTGLSLKYQAAHRSHRPALRWPKGILDPLLFFPLVSLWPLYRYTLKTEVEEKQNKDLNIALHILGVGTLK